MQPSVVSRRRFCSNLASAAVFAPAIVRAQNLNDKVDIAIVGCGGRGGANLSSVAGENIVALCDVNANNLESASRKFPNAATYSDFRRLFEKHKNFDAVVVSTCEHTHAFATMLALKAKKHVYCEKPLTHNIWEARKIREEAAKINALPRMTMSRRKWGFKFTRRKITGVWSRLFKAARSAA
jgi:hypothetical protein